MTSGPIYDYDDAPHRKPRSAQGGWGILASQIIGADVDQAVKLWRGSALCAETDPDTFFPEPGHTDITRQARVICGNCTMRAECYALSLQTREEYGIWGGLTTAQRLRQKEIPA